MLVFTPFQLMSQSTSQAKMEIRVEVSEGSAFYLKSMGVWVQTTLSESDQIIIDPISDEAARVQLDVRPGEIFSVYLPPQIVLTNSRGEKVDLKDFKIFFGYSEDPDQMQEISIEDCTHIQLPDRENVFLRIGAVIKGVFTPGERYTGTIQMNRSCIELR
jgi:hypothetical protein